MDFEKDIEKYRKILEQDPGSRAFAPLAEALRKSGKLDEAKEVCAKGIGLHPSYAAGRVVMGCILMDLGDFEGAVSELEWAVKSAPDNLSAWKKLAECYVKLGRNEKAAESYERVLSLNPDDIDARRFLDEKRGSQREESSASQVKEDDFKVVHASEAFTSSLPPDEVAPIQTETMADLFLSQGHPAKALAVMAHIIDAQGPTPERLSKLKHIISMLEETRSVPSVTKPQAALSEGKRPEDVRKVGRAALLETYLERIRKRRRA